MYGFNAGLTELSVMLNGSAYFRDHMENIWSVFDQITGPLC